MATISFNLNAVIDLRERAIAAARHYGTRHTYTTLHDPQYYPDGILRDKHGRTEAEAQEQGDIFWPSAEQATAKEPPLQLQLVGDHGVYLIPTVRGPSPKEQALVVYAIGMDPEKDADAHEKKAHIFGYDDGACDIPLDWIDLAIRHKKRRFSIRMTRNSYTLAL